MGKARLSSEERKAAKVQQDAEIVALKEQFHDALGPVDLSDLKCACRFVESADLGRLDLVFQESGSKVRVLQGLTPEEAQELRTAGSLEAYNRAKDPKSYGAPTP